MAIRNPRPGNATLITSLLVLALAQAAQAAVTPYAEDFEALDITDPAALGTAGWLVFGNVFDGMTGEFLFGYGPFDAPNGGESFSALVTGQGGPQQGVQQLSVYSDYNCCFPDEGHFVGNLVQAIVFREQTIEVGDTARAYHLRFDAKRGNIEGVTTAQAFIQTLDPEAGFAQTSVVRVDMTATPETWTPYSISVFLEEGFEGQILQFGFANTATNFEGSGVFYDNLVFAPNVGGQATGAIGIVARCFNQTSGQSLRIPLRGAQGWDCTQAGLVTNAGDTVLQIAIGLATGAPVAGDIQGLEGVFAACRNRRTGEGVSIPLDGATSWDCSAEGFETGSGDLVIQLSGGIAPAPPGIE